MKTNKLPSLEYLNECFYLDDTSPSGLRWKERSKNHFKTLKGYNYFTTRFANKPAGNKNTLGYFPISLLLNKRINILAHRIIYMLYNEVGDLGNLHIDHIDGNPSNNNPANLRLVSSLENMRNKKVAKNNSSGHPGVAFKNKKWNASININRKRFHLGSFTLLQDAINKRQEVEKEITSYYYKGLSKEDLIAKIKFPLTKRQQMERDGIKPQKRRKALVSQ